MTPWMEPITDASAWTAEDLKRDESWKFILTDDHRSDLDKALKPRKTLLGAVHSFGHWSYAKQRSRPNSLCHRWPTTPSKRSVDSR